jgi:hypothetical protein
VFDAHGAERVIGLVSSIAVGTLEGRVGACTTCAARGDCAGVVFGGMVLGADGVFGLVHLAELRVVTISLAVAALGGWVPGKVFINLA